MNISLLENGLHSLMRGVDTFRMYEESSEPEEQNRFVLKEAVMFLHHGIELLLKHILISKGGEFLIYSTLNKDTVQKVKRAKDNNQTVFDLDKPVHTATYLETIDRIQAFLDVPEISEPLKQDLKKLNSIRNNIEHYGVQHDRRDLEFLMLNIQEPLLSLLKEGGVDLGNDISSNWDDLQADILQAIMSLRGFPYIKDHKWGNGHITINYYDSYSSYKKDNPKTTITQKNYDSFWSTGNAISKALVDGAVRLFKKIPQTNRVKITLPYKGNEYSIDVREEHLLEFLGCTRQELIDNWGEVFSDKYVYGKDLWLFEEKFCSSLEDVADL